MSWLDSIKKLWSGDKESQVATDARGTSHVSPLGMSPSGEGAEGMQHLHDQLSVDTNLVRRYVDYENMDDYPEITSSLDIYADDASIPDSIHGKTVWAKSKDKVVRDLIDDMLQRRIRVEEDIWPAIRTLCKYGNLYAEIVVSELGVVGLNWLPVATMRRIVTEKGALIGFVQDISGMFNFNPNEVENIETARKSDKYEHLIFFHPWEIVHWRIRSKRMRSLYGYSVLDSARWIWKRLQMMEDTALVYKLTRSPARYAFYIDTGDLPPTEAMALVNKVRRRYKKKRLIDPTTGQLDFKYNPLTPDEDFWVPTRGGKESTRIEVISGPDYQNMEDIQYFQGKLLSAIKIPRQYLGFEGETNRAALSQEDVRFARTELRIQREFRNGLKKVVRIHLAALNIDPDTIKWDVAMTVPSAIFELQQIEVLNAQAGLADTLANYYPEEWLLQHVFHHTQDDATWLTKSKKEEIEAAAKAEAATGQDISQMYPEGMGMGADEGGEPGGFGESMSEKQLNQLVELAEENVKSNDNVVKKLNRIEPKIRFIDRKARSV